MTVWDFSDYTDITRTNYLGSANWDDGLNPARFGPLTIDSAAIYVDPAFTGEKTFTAYGRMKKNPAGTGGNGQYLYNLYLLANNGNYLGIGVRCLDGEVYSMHREAKASGRNNTVTDNPSSIAEQANRWVWFKIVYASNDNSAKFYYNISNSTTKPAIDAWTAFGEETLEMDEISELGFFGYGADNHAYIRGDDLEIAEYVREVEELDLGTAEIQDIYAYSKLGGGGHCEITIADPGSANKSTIEANIGKAIAIKDLTYVNPMFLGEVSRYRRISPDLCILEVKDGAAKLLDNETNHNPIIYSGKMYHREVDRIYDFQAAWDTAWGDAAYAITLSKEDPQRMKVHSDEVTWTPAPPDDVQGSIHDCYYNYYVPTDFWTNNSLVGRAVTTGSNELEMDCEFDFWLPSGADTTKIKPIDLEIRFRLIDHANLASGTTSIYYDVEPKISIYDYDGATWETLKTWTASNGIHRSSGGTLIAGYESWTDPYIYAEDLTEKVSGAMINYMSVIDAANASGLIHYRIRVKISTGSYKTGVTPRKYQIGLYYNHLDVISSEQNFPISPLVGLGKLHTDSTATMLVFDNTGWGSVQMPSEDGFSSEDNFVISKFIPDIMTDAFADSGVGLLLDWSVTDSDIYTIAVDISTSKLYELLQKLTSQFNAIWWYDGINTIYIRSVDLLSSTAITLTEDDIENFRDAALKYDNDASNLREKLTVQGKNVAYTIDPLSPEHALGLDTATVTVVDSTILAARDAQKRAENMRYQFEKTIKEIRIPLNFSDPLQSYRDLKLGETVAYVEPNAVGSVFNFSDAIVDGNAADGEMLITAWTYRWGISTDFQDLVDLVLQRRYN